MPLSDKRPLMMVINGQTRYFERTQAESDLNKALIDAYNTLVEVAAPINKIADLASVVIPIPVDDNGEEIKDKDLIDLLKKPNQFQTWEEYYRKAIIYKLLLGNVYENAFGYLTPSSRFELKLLPPQFTTVDIKSRKDFRNIEIDSYTVKIQGWNDLIIYDIDTVLHQKTTSPYFGKNADLDGQPRLTSCMANIESIRSGYDAKIGLYKHGPNLILTGKTQGEFAAANIQSNEDVQELQQRINSEYGLQSNQASVMITDIPLDVTKISMNIGELKINENNLSDFQAICRAFDIPSVILSDNANSTYNNISEARQAWLNDSFVSFIENDYAQRALWLSKLKGKKINLIADYKNIPEIIAKQNENNEEYLLLAQLGLITRNEYLERIGEEPVSDPEYDKYYTFANNEWIPVEKEIIEEPNMELNTDQDTETNNDNDGTN